MKRNWMVVLILLLLMVFGFMQIGAFAIETYYAKEVQRLKELPIKDRRFKAMPVNATFLFRAKKNPDLRSCQNDSQENALSIDWTKVRTTGQAEICIFLLAEKFDQPEEMMEFIDTQGFEVRELRSEEKPTLKSYGYTSDSEIIQGYASRDLRNQGIVFVQGLFLPIGIWPPSLERVRIFWHPDGQVLNVRVGYAYN
jgi:hypothetical protein